MSNNKDMVNHPDHYRVHAKECIDEMIIIFGKEAVLNHCKCNAWKYRYRAGNKFDKEEDERKADWYIQKALELEQELKREGK